MITIGAEGTEKGTRLVDGNNVCLCQGDFGCGHVLVAQVEF